jgi:mono/diheme cytochrome c family protein
MKLLKPAVLLAASLLAGTALAAPLTYDLPEETAVFKDAPGADVAINNCSACHSADYMRTQPPGMGIAFWTAEVNKMIKSFGAPIDPEDVADIAKYLASNY